MTYMRAWLSLKFGQIRRLVSMATDRVIIKRSDHFFLAVFHPILFILADNNNRHENSAIVDQILFIFVSMLCLFCAFTRPRYQVSVYRSIGPLVYAKGQLTPYSVIGSGRQLNSSIILCMPTFSASIKRIGPRKVETR